MVPLLQSPSPAATDILHFLSEPSRSWTGPRRLPRRQCASSCREFRAAVFAVETFRREMDCNGGGSYISRASDPDISRALRLRAVDSAGLLLLIAGIVRAR